MTANTETVLFSFWSKDWNQFMPVTLIEYATGGIDLHCQTGDHHTPALLLAKEQLTLSGLTVDESKPECDASTGVYYEVKKV